MKIYRKKLIEVDLPLAEINAESAREKSIRHGHPSTLHLWWARRPLAACRAVIFASMVDDPSACVEEFPTEEAQLAERERLHGIIRELVKWESTDERKTDVQVLLRQARYEIARSVARARGETAPTASADVLRYLADRALPIYDPFSGGGSIPLEAQRLGLKAVGTDLNPVAVLITKALIELPPKFRNRPPINPDVDPVVRGQRSVKTNCEKREKARKKNADPVGSGQPSLGPTTGAGPRGQATGHWRGAAGLADDIRYYGRWMREEAYRRVGHFYPKVRLRDGGEATVIAWLWARTVPCPNPACGAAMPLMRTFQVSKKKGNEHWIRPVVEGASVSFAVQNHSGGVPKGGTVDRNGATCIACNAGVKLTYVREQAQAGRMGEVMTAIVAEGNRKRLFASPTEGHVEAAQKAEPKWRPVGNLPKQALGFRVQAYGLTHWHQLFTARQLTALTTFSDLLGEVGEVIKRDGADEGYVNSIRTYLALAVGKNADYCSSFATLHVSLEAIRNIFARQAIPMVWDFAETNPFCNSIGNWLAHVERISNAVERLPVDANAGETHQADASTTIYADSGPVIVTDPPYYDNIGYADLSDFFYVWLRPLLRGIYPELFAGILVPKAEEMIASRFRFDNPRERFEDLLNKTLRLIRKRCSPEFPSSIFYAYKQQEMARGGRTSTGWDTMLSALVNAGFQIISTWPMRTELGNRPVSQGTNALASSVVLVCRPRAEDAIMVTRRQFLDALERDLPADLDHLTREGHIAPVDLAQAAIGPGMKIYSQYSSVETIGGEPVPVREALAEINRVIAEYHQREQGNLDAESRFCMDWLRQNGYGEGRYGDAEVLAQAKNVSIDALSIRHLLTAGGGRVRLLPVDEYGPDRPFSLLKMTAWEGCFRMAYHLDTKREDGGGIPGAARVARAMDGNAESVERLARILYEHHDRKGESQNAVLFNHLVAEWQDIVERMQIEEQGTLL